MREWIIRFTIVLFFFGLYGFAETLQNSPGDEVETLNVRGGQDEEFIEWAIPGGSRADMIIDVQRAMLED